MPNLPNQEFRQLVPLLREKGFYEHEVNITYLKSKRPKKHYSLSEKKLMALNSSSLKENQENH